MILGARITRVNNYINFLMLCNVIFVEGRSKLLNHIRELARIRDLNSDGPFCISTVYTPYRKKLHIQNGHRSILPHAANLQLEGAPYGTLAISTTMLSW